MYAELRKSIVSPIWWMLDSVYWQCTQWNSECCYINWLQSYWSIEHGATSRWVCLALSLPLSLLILKPCMGTILLKELFTFHLHSSEGGVDAFIFLDNSTVLFKFDVFLQTVPPTFNDDSPRNVSVVLDDVTELECAPKLSVPLATITWYKNGRRLQRYETNSFISSDGTRLQIRNAQLQDTGVYTCVARNLVGNSTKIFNIEIYSKLSKISYVFWLFELSHFVLYRSNLTFLNATFFRKEYKYLS